MPPDPAQKCTTLTLSASTHAECCSYGVVDGVGCCWRKRAEGVTRKAGHQEVRTAGPYWIAGTNLFYQCQSLIIESNIFGTLKNKYM